MNPQCPDHAAHSQNAAEQLFPRGVPETLNQEQSAAVDALAEAEYLACEGH
jgi:hypothetical protein